MAPLKSTKCFPPPPAKVIEPHDLGQWEMGLLAGCSGEGVPESGSFALSFGSSVLERGQTGA